MATKCLEDMSIVCFHAGKSFSIENGYEENNDLGLNIHFQNGQNYTFFTHDSDFYIFTLNPATVPHIQLTIDDPKNQWIYYIKAIYHKRMNKPNDNCNSGKSYTFTGCVKTFSAEKLAVESSGMPGVS